MKRYITYLIMMFLIVADGCSLGSNENINPSMSVPEVKIGVPGNPVYPGDFLLTIDISNVLNVAGLYFRIYFDPKIIQIKNKDNLNSSVSEGTFFKQGEVSTGLGVGFLQNSDSCLLVGLSRAGGKPGINGSGTILTFTFTTLSAGSTSVKFTETEADNALFTPELENISGVKWTNGEVTVQ